MLKNSIKQKLLFWKRRHRASECGRKEFVNALRGGFVLGRCRLSVQVQTVSTCNASCYFCPYQESWHKENPGIMEEITYRNIIDKVSKYKVEKFCPYLENEPLLDPYIFDRIEYGVSRLDFLILELSTNAALLDNKKINDVVRIFSGVPHELRISFHGVDKYSYESIMGLDYERSLSNVLALIDASQNSDLNIKILGSGSPVLAKSNVPIWFDEKSYFSFWNEKFHRQGLKKIPVVNYFRYHDRAGSIDRNEVNFSEVFSRELKDFYCHRLDQWLHFLYTGELILCCMDYHKKTVFGDINHDDLEAIFSSKRYLELANKVTGLCVSDDNFICKKCISPGG